MEHKKNLLILMLLCIGCFLPQAQAQAQAQAEQLPYYYGVSVGKSKFHQAGGGDPTIAIYLGRHLNDNFSIEAGYTDLGEDDDPAIASQISSLYGGGLVTLRSSTYPRVSGFLNAGLSSWYYKVGSDRDSGVDLYYGLGAFYALDNTLSLRFGLNRYVANPKIAGVEIDEEVSVYSFGVQYRP
jgi:hypothetical protein